MAKVYLKKQASFAGLKKKTLIFLVVFFLLFIITGVFVVSLVKSLPSPTQLTKGALPESTTIYDRNGHLLYTIYASQNRTFIPLAKIPLSVQNATIAVEDKDFYRHGAIDLRGIARALSAIIMHKRLEGGSTLTQQLVKNSLLTPERTLERKIKEVVLAFLTEKIYSKKQILEMYLNQIPYGGTAYGIEAAAETYFGKHAKDLDTAESALLAGLPEAPTTFSPFGSRPELAKKRQEEILNKMYQQGYINKEELQKSLAEKLKFQKIATGIKAPHFVLYVKDLLSRKYGSNVVEKGGLKVITSLDLPLQDFVQATVATEVAKLKRFKVGNGAALVTNPATGEILAMVGSKNYFSDKSGNVNMTLARLQPGSSIKPINYAVGLMKGYTAATPFIDKPTCFPGGGKPYCPGNYDGKFRGPIQMRYALGNSINIPAVEMLKLNGIDAMIATASAMGITTFTDPSRYGLSLTLGGAEVTMTDMATAYAVFANGGYRINLHPILKVTDRTGRVLEEYKAPAKPIFGRKVLSPGVAYIISDILSDNSARTEAFGPNSELRIGNYKISVKTGTTNDYRDNWTVGYTPKYLTAVWVGNNDHSAMSGIVSGVTGAAPIWHQIMSHLVNKKTAVVPSKPDDVFGMSVCATSGLIPPPPGTPDRCPTRFEYFLKGKGPRGVDPGKQKTWIDKTTNNLPAPNQTANLELRDEVIITDPLGNRFCLSCPAPTPAPNH